MNTKCPNCHQTYECDESMRNSEITCQKCGMDFIIQEALNEDNENSTKSLLELYHLQNVYFNYPYPDYKTFHTAYVFDIPLCGKNSMDLLAAIKQAGIEEYLNDSRKLRKKEKEKGIDGSPLYSIFNDILIPNSPASTIAIDNLVSRNNISISADVKLLKKDLDSIECKFEELVAKCPYCGGDISFDDVACDDDDFCPKCYEDIKYKIKVSRRKNGSLSLSASALKRKIGTKKNKTEYENGPFEIEEYKDQKRRWIYIMLALFLGLFGVHNFYARRIFNGILQLLLTLSLIGIIITIIWVISDIRSIKQDGRGVPFLGYEHCIQSSQKWGCFQIGSLVFLILLLIGLIMTMIEKINESKRQPQKIEQLKK